MNIIYSDEYLVICNKPPGIPVQPDKTGDESLVEQVSAHLGTTLFVVHRIDRPVSGLVLLARNKDVAAQLSSQFQSHLLTKIYIAAVSGSLPSDTGEMVHYLKRNAGSHKAVTSVEPEKGSTKSVLQYKVIGKTERYQFLEINLITGKFHQIRAQLSAAGCPVKGDVKYGARRANADRSIHLHAWKMTFRHPHSHQEISFEAPLPDSDGLWKALSEML